MKAILIRTSTEDQNPENQLKDCESIAGTDYTLFEEKQSAWKDNKERPKLEELKEQIKQGKVTDLYVWDWDRIYRNRKNLKAFFEFCKIYKCKVHSYRQKFYEQLNNLQEPFNEIMQSVFLDLLGWLAEDESKKKSDRVRISIRKDTGVTLSHKGNKWGRKVLPLETKQAILEAYQANKPYSKICSEVFYWDKNRNKKFVSKGIVHKTIAEFKASNPRIAVVH